MNPHGSPSLQDSSHGVPLRAREKICSVLAIELVEPTELLILLSNLAWD